MNNQYHKIKKQIFKYEKFGYGLFMQLNLIKKLSFVDLNHGKW